MDGQMIKALEYFPPIYLHSWSGASVNVEVIFAILFINPIHRSVDELM